MTSPDNKPSRLDQARVTARELVEALEADEPIAKCLMKAQRLARLLRDTEAQTWLTYEASGYPATGDAENEIGWCGKYAIRFVEGERGSALGNV